MALMLREDGFVFDDGTTARLAEDRYFMTTTTAMPDAYSSTCNSAIRCCGPNWTCNSCPPSMMGAVFVAGPRARDTLAGIVDAPFSLASNAFPYMAATDLTVCGGTPARLFRLSFSGELAYEVGVPARYGDALARF